MGRTRPGVRAATRVNLLAVIYTRVSEDDQRQRRSVGEQEQECREAATDEGWAVARVFVDNDRSASRYARKVREQYAELLAYLDANPVDVLILWESSRGGRELESWAGLLNLCRRRGIRIHIYTHGRTYDLENPRDWRTLAEDGVDSAYESEKTRVRILRSVRSGATRGKPHGKLLFGYRRTYDDRGNFLAQVIDDSQAVIIREIARRVVKGEACYSIAQDLNERSISTPLAHALLAKAERTTDEEERKELIDKANSLEWDLTQVKRTVVNPGYIGKRVYRGEIIGDADWPPILGETEYAVCVARLNDPARRTMRDRILKHLLSGTAVGWKDECGGKMRVQKNRTHLAYICMKDFCTSIKLETLEDYVTDVILERLSRPDAAKIIRQPVEESKSDAEAAKATVDELKARMESFYAQASEGKLSATGLAAIEARLLPDIEAAEERVQTAVAYPMLLELATIDAAAVWKSWNVAQRREAVRLLMDVRVLPTTRGARIFDPKRVSIRWKISGFA